MAAILVVDDEAGIREFMVETLSVDGHSITEAVDGSEALGCLNRRRFDLLITDLRMPGPLDGIGLLKAARAAHPEMKVIVLTAYGTVGTAVDAMKLGANDYLEKPVSGPTELRILVSRALEARIKNGNGAHAAADPMKQLASEVGRALGPDYDVEGTLGRGGYAVIFRVHDRRLNRQLAAKVLLPEFAAITDTAERFRREAQTVARLSHPNIVPVYFVGREGDVPCLVMPFIEGEALSALLDRQGKLALPLVLRITRDVAAALDFAHQAGVIHRDVKPDNILLQSTTSRSLLTDFGIAKALAPGSSGTGPGTFIGTPRYVSPEQATGEQDLDARTDIYSLGVVVYEMISGKPPFAGGNALRTLGQHVSARVPPLHKRIPGVNRHIDVVIARALAKGPAERFATAGSFVFALQVAAGLGDGKG